MFFNLQLNLSIYFGLSLVNETQYQMTQQRFTWNKIVKVDKYNYAFEGEDNYGNKASGYLRFNPTKEAKPDFAIKVYLKDSEELWEEYKPLHSLEAIKIKEKFKDIWFGDF